MEQRRTILGLPMFFTILSYVLLLLCFSRSVQAYKNYTVGDSLGWYDNQEKPNINYQKWASGKNFALGDFLSKLNTFFFFPHLYMYIYVTFFSYSFFYSYIFLTNFALNFLLIINPFFSCLAIKVVEFA